MKTSKFGDFRSLKTFMIRDVLKIFRFGRLRSFSGPDLDGQENFGGLPEHWRCPIGSGVGPGNIWGGLGASWTPPDDPRKNKEYFSTKCSEEAYL